MSILNFLLKSKKSMAKANALPIRIGEFNITAHTQNRIADPSRHLKKTDLIDNLFEDPIAILPVKYEVEIKPSYTRIGKVATTQINPENNNVNTIYRTNAREAKKYGYEKRGRKYVEKIK